MANGPDICKLGAWSPQNDTLVAHPASPTGTVIDLNDGVIFSLVDKEGKGTGLDLGHPGPSVLKANNARVNSAVITKRIYNDTRIVTAHLSWAGTAWSSWNTAIHNLVQTLEGITKEKPAALAVQPSGSSTTLYLDVMEAHVDKLPYNSLKWQQFIEDELELVFQCKPFLRGPQTTLQNLSTNPGFEQGSGPGVTVFNDPLTNFNAYANQYIANVETDSTSLLRFYPLFEGTGATLAQDFSFNGHSLTYSNVTLGTTGGIANDPSTCVTIGATSTISGDVVGLPTGASAWSIAGWVYCAGTGSANQTIAMFGSSGTAHDCAQLTLTATNVPFVSDGTTSATAGSAISSSAWHFLVGTYDGTNLRLYVDGSLAAGPTATTAALSATGAKTSLGAAWNGTAYSQPFTSGRLQDVGFYNTALTSARITALYTLGSTALVQDKFTYADTVLADAPLHYYRLDETSGTTYYDAMGSGQNGTGSGTLTQNQTSLLTGDSDPALKFDGSTGYVALTNTGTWPTGNGTWTLECWCKPLNNTNANNATLVAIGNPGTNASTGQIAQTSTGGWTIATWGGTGHDYNSNGTSTAGTIYHVVGTYDGTSLRLYINNVMYGPFTPSSLNLTSVHQSIGGSWNGSVETLFFPGVIDEVAIYGTALSTARVSAHYTTGTTAPSSTSNTMVVPNGSRYLFGDGNWNAINTWQVRMRYASSLTATFYLHWQGATYNIAATVTGTALALVQIDNGVTTTLATQSINLTPGMQYWLQITQFPSVPGGLAPSSSNAQAQVVLYADNAGVPGNKIATAGPIAIQDGFLYANPNSSTQFTATGANLAIGGNFGKVHALSLFGPGGWSFASTGTGVATGSWEQLNLNGVLDAHYQPINTNLYSGGPVKSVGAGRVLFPPTGTMAATWTNADTSSTTRITQTALNTPPSHTWYASAWVMSSNLSNTATISLTCNEYNSSGTFLRSVAVSGATVTGNQGSYTQIAGTYTSSAVGNNTAYFALVVNVTDSAATRAPGLYGPTSMLVWIENVQVWDSANGSTMPYCELYFNQSPAQLMVSGLVGDTIAPVTLALGTLYNPILLSTITAILGRRSQATRAALLVGPAYAQNATWTYVLDPNSYAGFYLATTNVHGSYPPIGLWTPSYEPSLPVGVSGQGTYELYTRFLTSESTGNIANVTIAPIVRQDNGVGVYTTGLGTIIAQVKGAAYAPFTTGSMANFALVDAGQIILPPYPIGALANNPATWFAAQTSWDDTTGGGSAAQANWLAAVPKDASFLMAQISSINTISPNPFFLYVDGLSSQLGMTTPWTSTGNWLSQSLGIVGVGNGAGPAVSAGGPGATGGPTCVINPTADPYLTIDPSLLGGVNQFVAILTGTSGEVLPCYAQLTYIPLYLDPK